VVLRVLRGKKYKKIAFLLVLVYYISKGVIAALNAKIPRIAFLSYRT